jgi:GntR family transcriptional regulator
VSAETGGRPGRAQQASLVRDLLREHLLHGGPRRGQRLPYEHTLCRQLGCSRNVLREALGLLVADGLVRRERGRGTHVVTTSPAIRMDQGLDLMAALGEDVLPPARGQAQFYRVLLTETISAPPVLAALLARPVGTPVVHVERLVEVDGRRVGHWDLHIITGIVPEARIPGLARTQACEDMLRIIGLGPHHEELRFEAIAPSPRTAGLLYQGRKQPTLRLSRRFHAPDASVLALAIGRCALPGATFAVIRQCAAGGMSGGG